MVEFHDHGGLHTAVRVFQYGSPLLVFIYWVLSIILTIFNGKTELLRIKNQGAKRGLILSFLVAVIVTYGVQILLLVFGQPTTLTDSSAALTFDFASLNVWMVQFLALFDCEYPVWYPYFGSWMLAFVFEAVTIILEAVAHPPTDVYDALSCAIGSLRLLLFLLLPVILWCLKDKDRTYIIDEERTPLFFGQRNPNEDALIGVPSSSKDPRYYGPNYKTMPTSFAEVVIDASLPATEEARRERLLERLKLDGSWWTFIKELSSFFIWIWPSGSMKDQISLFFVGICLLALPVMNLLEVNQLGVAINAIVDNGSAFLHVGLLVFFLWMNSSIGARGYFDCFWLPVYQSAILRIRMATFNRLMALSAHINGRRSMVSIYEISQHSHCLIDAVEAIILQVIPLMANLLVAFVFLWYLVGPTVALLLLTTTMLQLWAVTWMSPYQSALHTSSLEEVRGEHQTLYQMLTNWRSVFYSNTTKIESRGYASVVQWMMDSKARSFLGQYGLAGTQNLFSIIGFAAGEMITLYNIGYGEGRPGDMLVFIFYWLRLQGPVLSFSNVYYGIVDGLVEAESVQKLFKQEPFVLLEDTVDSEVNDAFDDTVDGSVDDTVDITVNRTVLEPVEEIADPAINETIDNTVIDNSTDDIADTTEDNLVENTVDDDVENNVDNTFEDDVEDNVEITVENDVEDIMEADIETTVKYTVENDVKNIVEDNIEDTVDDGVGSIVEDHVENNVEHPTDNIINSVDSSAKFDPEINDGTVELVDVSFSSEERALVQHVDLKVEAGRSVGLVGRKGSGNKAILNLLYRLYDIDTGLITIDGHDIRAFSLNYLRNQIAILPKNMSLLPGSIGDNLRYCLRHASGDQAVVEMCKTVGIHDKIMSLPCKYGSKIELSGDMLSKRELLKIRIARALLQDPKVVLVDEVQAASKRGKDREVDRDFVDTLSLLIKGRTTFLLGLELCIQLNPDSIVVFDRGEIIERGTHQQLMNLKGLYHEMLSPQGASDEAGPSGFGRITELDDTISSSAAGDLVVGPSTLKNGLDRFKQGLHRLRSDEQARKLKGLSFASRLWKPDVPEFVPTQLRIASGEDQSTKASGEHSETNQQPEPSTPSHTHHWQKPARAMTPKDRNETSQRSPERHLQKTEKPEPKKDHETTAHWRSHQNQKETKSQRPGNDDTQKRKTSGNHGRSRKRHGRDRSSKAQAPPETEQPVEAQKSVSSSDIASKAQNNSEAQVAAESQPVSTDSPAQDPFPDHSEGDGAVDVAVAGDQKDYRSVRKRQSKSEPTSASWEQTDGPADVTEESGDAQSKLAHIRRVSAPSHVLGPKDTKRPAAARRRRPRHWRQRKNAGSSTEASAPTGSSSMESPIIESPAGPSASPADGPTEVDGLAQPLVATHTTSVSEA